MQRYVLEICKSTVNNRPEKDNKYRSAMIPPTIFDKISITKTRLFKKYIENFTFKTEKFQIKTLIFLIFLLKHRLWVLVRTASVPTIYVFEQKYEK